MEFSKDFNYVVDGDQEKHDDASGDQTANFVQPSFDIQLSAFHSSKLSLSTSFEESIAMTAAEIHNQQAIGDNGNIYADEANFALNDNDSGGKMFSSGVTGCGAASALSYVPVASAKEQSSQNIDFGESVALDDFGGDFDEGGCAMDTMPRATDIFADETGATNFTDAGSNGRCEKVTQVCSTIDAETLQLEEERLCPPTLIREDAVNDKSNGSEPGNIETLEKELNDSEDALEAVHVSQKIFDDGDNTKSTEQASSRKVHQQTSLDSIRDSSVELNVNSRPRRSIARKSVFELLQVEYRCSSGNRKHVASVVDGDNDVGNTEGLKRKSHSKKKKQLTDHVGDETGNKVTYEQDAAVSGEEDLHPSKVVSYVPDDFLADANEESAVHKSTEETGIEKMDVPVRMKASKLNRRKLTGSHVTNSQPEICNQNTFAAEFELASADVLCQSKSGEENSKTEADLIAENCRLRERLKALEENNSVVKKFKIDLHSRKFSRIRSPVIGSGLERKTPGKWDLVTACDSAKTSESGDVEEAWKSRSALLDRREHKLRELSAELDERASAIKISEGSLLRRERKLTELEKTLEYRERVLSRHEQNVQKRELALELTSSTELGSNADETSGEQTTLITEFQKRLDLRRQELDRRQNFLDTEREKLVSRERVVEHREHELQLKLHGQSCSDGKSLQDSDEEDMTAIKPMVSKSINSGAKGKAQNQQKNSSSVKKAKVTDI